MRLALILVAVLALPERALAERRFAAERTITTTAVPNAGTYAWEIAAVPPAPAGWASLTVTTDPVVVARGPWRQISTFRVRALPPAGSTQYLAGPWSDASEPASWWPDPDVDGNGIVGGAEFSAFRTVFGWRNCAGEWAPTGACP